MHLNLELILYNNAASSFTAEGVYEVVYNITLAADYAMSISLGTNPIYNPQQELTLIPNNIYPLETVATNIIADVVAGELNQIQVQLRDVYANEITNVPEPAGIVVASFEGVNVSAAVAVEYVNSGLYTLSYNATYATTYSLTILVLDTSINGGVYPIEVAPAAAYPPLCLIEGAGVSSSVAGVPSSFNVYLYDVFNNLITEPAPSDIPVVTIGEVVYFLNYVEFKLNLLQQPVNVVFNTELNTFVVGYTITQSAVFGVQIFINGTQIRNSDLTVAPAPLDVANSNATGSALECMSSIPFWSLFLTVAISYTCRIEYVILYLSTRSIQ